ncbi:MAG: TlpA family protein disulfide reductase [Leptospiraceae bacterium]|nr:TlpA family protein disulfide reductase [Leptospiraceae bacterium]
MKTSWKLLISLFLIAAAIASFYIYSKFRIAPGLPFERIVLQDVTGQKRTLADAIRDSKAAVILFFGQSWCSDCHHELPRLKKARDQFFPETNVFVLSDEKPSLVFGWQSNSGIHFPFFRITPSLDSFGVVAYPTTYIISQDFEILYSKVGDVNWSSKEVIRVITEN